MSGKKKTGQYRTLAIVWTLAALAMLWAAIRRAPDTDGFILIIFVLSVAVAALWWSAYLKASKNKDSK